MTRLKHGNLSDLSESDISLKKYSVIVETCSGASNAKVRECAKEVLSRGCRDIYFTGYDCNRWHNIFDEEDSAHYGGKALTSDMHDAFSLYSCKNKVYILYQSRFIKKRLNQNIKEMANYIELFYEDNGVVLMTESSSEKTDHFSFTVKIYKNSISLEKMAQIGESVLKREMDVKCIKTTIIDKDKVILDVYNEYPVLQRITISIDSDITKYVESGDSFDGGILEDTQVVADWMSFMGTVEGVIEFEENFSLGTTETGKGLPIDPNVPSSRCYYVDVENTDNEIVCHLEVHFQFSTHTSIDKFNIRKNTIQVVQETTYPVDTDSGQPRQIIIKRDYSDYDLAMLAVIEMLNEIGK